MKNEKFILLILASLMAFIFVGCTQSANANTNVNVEYKYKITGVLADDPCL